MSSREQILESIVLQLIRARNASMVEALDILHNTVEESLEQLPKDDPLWKGKLSSEVKPHSIDVTGKVLIIADFSMSYGVSPDDKDYAAAALGVLKDYEETFVLQQDENHPDAPFCSIATLSKIKFSQVIEFSANENY